MVVVDIFVVRWAGAASSLPPHSIEDLRLQMDEMAPAPWRGVCPKGDPVIIFGVNPARSPSAVCARMGFEYVHVCFVEVEDDTYSPLNELVFRRFGWVRVLLMVWTLEMA